MTSLPCLPFIWYCVLAFLFLAKIDLLSVKLICYVKVITDYCLLSVTCMFVSGFWTPFSDFSAQLVDWTILLLSQRPVALIFCFSASTFGLQFGTGSG